MQGQLFVSAYFTRFKALWDEFVNLCPFPECSCGAMKTLMGTHQRDHVMRILLGLRDYYTQVRSQFLMTEALSTVNKAYSLVIQEEKQREIGNGSNSFVEATALYSNLKPNSASGKGNSREENPIYTDIPTMVM